MAQLIGDIKISIGELQAKMKEAFEIQQTFHVQMGKSMVAMHKETLTLNEQSMKRIEASMSLRNSTNSMESLISTEPRNDRPVYVSPPPAIPRFKGDGSKHPVKFIEELETYIRKLEIPYNKQLDTVYDALSGNAEDWSTIYKLSWMNFGDFKEDFLDSYWSDIEQNKVRHQISSHKWITNNRYSMENHFAKYVGLARLLTKPIPEDVLLSEIMRHFPKHIQSLWMLKENRTIAKAAQFLRHQDNISAAGSSRYETGYFSGNPNPYKKIRTETNTDIANRQSNNVSGNGPRSN